MAMRRRRPVPRITATALNCVWPCRIRRERASAPADINSIQVRGKDLSFHLLNGLWFYWSFHSYGISFVVKFVISFVVLFVERFVLFVVCFVFSLERQLHYLLAFISDVFILIVYLSRVSIRPFSKSDFSAFSYVNNFAHVSLFS